MDDSVISSIADKLSPSDIKPTGIIKAAPRIPAKIKISHSKDWLPHIEDESRQYTNKSVHEMLNERDDPIK